MKLYVLITYILCHFASFNSYADKVKDDDLVGTWGAFIVCKDKSEKIFACENAPLFISKVGGEEMLTVQSQNKLFFLEGGGFIEMVSIGVRENLINAKLRNIPILGKDHEGIVAYTGVMKKKVACVYLWPVIEQHKINELAILKRENSWEILKDLIDWLIVMKRLESLT
ncbi:hypothetical protein [Endozoicomonas sp. Mp262]|uniref:hypothetical protein n=1 Tax=Endozoicomonas sp. Mp262 TaxID=2919499 RepID=UPI0021DF6392